LGPEPRETPDRGEQAAVLDARPLDMRQQPAREQAAQCRQAEPGLASFERREAGLEALPGIAVAIPGRAAHRALAQARDRIAVGVDLARLLRRIGRMEEAAILGREQEDQAIDEAEQLFVVALGRERSRPQRLAQRVV